MKEILYTYWQNRDINDMEGEIWKDIPETAGGYQASNFGRIKSWVRREYYLYENGELIKKFKPLILKQTIANTGYLIVMLKLPNIKKNKWSMVHRVICETFHPNPNSLPIVHHKKNVRSCNCINNLMWVSHKQNSGFIQHEHGNYDIINVSKESNAELVPENSLYKKGFTYIYGITDENNNIIYVGKSCNPFRRFRNHKTIAKASGHRMNLFKDYILEDRKLDFAILKQCKLTEWSKWEIYFIKKYRKINPNLLNNADGGVFNLSKESKIKSCTSRYKIVLQYSRFGIFIKEWPSLKHAANHANIVACGLSGTIKYNSLTANCLWRFKTSEDFPLKIDAYNSLKGLPVLQYSLSGIFIREWANAEVARIKLNTTTSQIYLGIKHHHRIAGNSLWRLKTDKSYPKQIPIPKPNRTFKPIFQIMEDGSKIRHNSIADAAIALSITPAHISEGIRENKKSGGFYFEKDMSCARWQNKHGKL